MVYGQGLNKQKVHSSPGAELGAHDRTMTEGRNTYDPVRMYAVKDAWPKRITNQGVGVPLGLGARAPPTLEPPVSVGGWQTNVGGGLWADGRQAGVSGPRPRLKAHDHANGTGRILTRGSSRS